jgi:hypothetical protein
VRDDAYEERASSYQCPQVAALDAAMRGQGIVDAAPRRRVCDSSLSEMGNVHDRCWLKPSADAETVDPLLCFSRRFLDADTPVEEPGVVYAPSLLFAFHEYAHGNASLLHEGDPNAEVETGHRSDGGRTRRGAGPHPGRRRNGGMAGADEAGTGPGSSRNPAPSRPGP